MLSDFLMLLIVAVLALAVRATKGTLERRNDYREAIFA